MKVTLLFFALLGYFLAVKAEQVEVYQRCEDCHGGGCKAQTMETDVCLEFYDFCENQSKGSYILQPDSDDSDNYAIKIFFNQNCSSVLQLETTVSCSACLSDRNCGGYYNPEFFISCDSYWMWALSFGILFFGGCVLVVAGVLAFLRRRQLKAFISGKDQPEFVTYEKTVDQELS